MNLVNEVLHIDPATRSSRRWAPPPTDPLLSVQPFKRATLPPPGSSYNNVGTGNSYQDSVNNLSSMDYPEPSYQHLPSETSPSFQQQGRPMHNTSRVMTESPYRQEDSRFKQPNNNAGSNANYQQNFVNASVSEIRYQPEEPVYQPHSNESFQQNNSAYLPEYQENFKGQKPFNKNNITVPKKDSYLPTNSSTSTITSGSYNNTHQQNKNDSFGIANNEQSIFFCIVELLWSN